MCGNKNGSIVAAHKCDCIYLNIYVHMYLYCEGTSICNLKLRICCAPSALTSAHLRFARSAYVRWKCQRLRKRTPTRTHTQTDSTWGERALSACTAMWICMYNGKCCLESEVHRQFARRVSITSQTAYNQARRLGHTESRKTTNIFTSLYENTLLYNILSNTVCPVHINIWCSPRNRMKHLTREQVLLYIRSVPSETEHTVYMQLFDRITQPTKMRFIYAMEYSFITRIPFHRSSVLVLL